MKIKVNFALFIFLLAISTYFLSTIIHESVHIIDLSFQKVGISQACLLGWEANNLPFPLNLGNGGWVIPNSSSLKFENQTFYTPKGIFNPYAMELKAYAVQIIFIVVFMVLVWRHIISSSDKSDMPKHQPTRQLPK